MIYAQPVGFTDLRRRGQSIVQTLRREGREVEAATVAELVAVLDLSAPVYLSVEEVAERLDLPQWLVEKAVALGTLESVMIENQPMIAESSLTKVQELLDASRNLPKVSDVDLNMALVTERVNWTWVGQEG